MYSVSSALDIASPSFYIQAVNDTFVQAVYKSPTKLIL